MLILAIPIREFYEEKSANLDCTWKGIKMNKKTVRDIDVHDKKVLVRCDFNVPYNSDRVITDNRRIVAALPTIKYLLDNNTNSLNEEIIADFVKETYNFDYYNPINNNQLDKIKYLKNLLEFKATGNYLKKHANIIISNDKFCDVYREYENYLNTKDIKPITKKCKLIKTKLFLNS